MKYMSYKTVSANKNTVKKEWLVVDATDAVVGRLASQIVHLLRGKHKPLYTPHVDCGDHVIVINCDKVRFTGKKWDEKLYIRHTGYPGGQRALTAKQLKAKSSTRLIEHAVKGMLPKNRLGRQLFKNLHLYEGAEHPHQAQQPKEYKLKY